ncbi:hypothetical protein FKM82_026931 [Ascaphus truei]
MDISLPPGRSGSVSGASGPESTDGTARHKDPHKPGTRQGKHTQERNEREVTERKRLGPSPIPEGGKTSRPSGQGVLGGRPGAAERDVHYET